jgi:hypothetical protein
VKNVTLAATAFLAVVAAGCTSSSKPSAAPVSPSTSAVTSSSVSSSAPAPSPTATKPLSPFEADPAVMALRAWAAEFGRTINTGHYDSAALDALMTSQMRSGMKAIGGGEVGHRYPGPLPFTPIGVTVTSSTTRDVQICIVAGGYSLNPKTGKPFSKYRKLATAAGAVLSHGRWLVSKFGDAKFSCASVTISEPSW